MADDYAQAVGQVFRRLVQGIDRLDPDVVEADATGDMVTITAVQTKEKVIVNTQRAVEQIWVAGRGEGVHFSRGPDGAWWDDKGKGRELLAWVSSCVSQATGSSVSL
jgi:CyaY protein